MKQFVRKKCTKNNEEFPINQDGIKINYKNHAEMNCQFSNV